MVTPQHDLCHRYSQDNRVFQVSAVGRGDAAASESSPCESTSFAAASPSSAAGSKLTAPPTAQKGQATGLLVELINDASMGFNPGLAFK